MLPPRPLGKGSTSSSIPCAGQHSTSFGAVKPYAGRVVSILGWGTHSWLRCRFVAPHIRACASRRDTCPRNVTRGSRKLKPLLDGRRFSVADLGAAYDFVEFGSLVNLVV